MDINSRDPSQNIIPFRIKGVDVGRFDTSGNLGIGTINPTATLEVVGNVKINGNNNAYNNIDAGFTLNGLPIESKTTVVVNMDSQPVAATTLNRQKKQSIPLSAASTLATSDIVAKMSGVSVGKTQIYGVGPAQMASYGNIVVAVGEGTNCIAYSLANPPTASSWVGIPNSAATFTTRGRNIAYANGTWVAVGEGTNCIAYSTMTPPVASSWVGIPTGSSFNGVVNTFGTTGHDIAYGNGAWVAVGLGTNSISYSLANPPTAESWVGIPLSFSPTLFGTNSLGITFGNGTWVATGQGTNGIAYSVRTPPTADSWTVVPLSNTNDAGVNNIYSARGFNVTYANGVWLAAGNGNNTLCYSVENPPIAGSWMPITNTVLFGTNGYSLAYGNGMWVACGDASGTLLAYSTSRIPHSSSWVSLRGPMQSTTSELINHITFNAATNTWYFLGDVSNNCMFYSTATPPVPATWVGVQRSAGAFTTQAYGAVGITTNAFTSPINVARLDNKVTFPANRMLAVGGGGAEVLARSANTPTPATTGTISYSDDDGATWQMVPGGATNAMFSSAADIAAGTSFGIGGSRGANAVAWNGEKWVAGGNGRTNSLAFSDDGGMTWTGITGKSIFSVEARDIAWNGRMWVAVGRGIQFSTAYSYDGISWMGPVDASGTPVNVFSFNIAGPTAAMSDISGGGNHVIWTGKMWVATGTRTLITGSSPAAYYTIAYSMDGKSWIGVPESGATSTGFDMYAHGLAWNGRNYIVTGRGTANTLAFSTDATSWQGLGNTVFSVWGRGITWGAKRWMATGRGTNTVAYSTNGRNWQGCGANVFKPMRRFMAMGDTGLYTTVSSGQPQRGVAITYSDDGITWDAPVVNQGVEFKTTRFLPNAFYIRTGFSNWRDFIPLLTANSTTNLQNWGPDSQFNDVNTAPQNEIAKQFAYFAGYWLNAIRAMNSQSFSVFTSFGTGGSGTFTFTATSNYPVTSYTGSLSNYTSNTTYTLTPQTDGINAGIINSSIVNPPCSIFTNQFLLTNAISDNSSQHTALMYSSDVGASWARVSGTSDTEANGGTGMTVSNSGVFSLASNTTRTRFLVGGGDAGSATRKVYFSNDGFNWNRSISSPNSTQMAFVNASLWVGGGYNRWLVGGSDATTNANGRIMYSGDTDAVAAWLAASPATYTGTVISCFAANANFSVILAGTVTGNVIYRSENGGATWATVNISSTPTGSVRSIAFSPSLGRWVAVGGGGGAANTIIYSTDATGTAWALPSGQAKAASTAIFKIGSEVTRVIWDAVGERFLIGGWNGGSVATLTNIAGLDSTNNNTGYTMAYSSNGINWTPVIVRSDTGTSTGGISPGASMFGPFLTQCREIMALDMSGDFTPINTGYSVSWNSYANRFIATGNGTTPVVYSSDGGVTWTPANQQPQQQAIAVAGGLGTAAATTATSASHITYTIDGKTWSQGIGVKEIFGTGTVLAVKYGQTSTAISPNGRIWVAGGTPTSGTSCLAFSQNGVRWTAITSASTMITNVRTIAYAPAEQMIAVPGVNNNVNNALTTATSGVGNGVWVAGGDTTNSLVFSYDGISWSEVPNSLTILSTCNACAFGNGLFVAGGIASSSNPIDSTAIMVYSTDGINWQPIRGTRARVANNASIGSITYGRDENGRGLWVAGVIGSLTISILYSYNGIDWIGVPSSGSNLAANVTGIAYGQSTSTGQGLWIASVRNAGYSFVFSTNGRDGWTSISNTKSGLFEVTGSGATSITYFNGVWYATGVSAGVSTGRTLAYSYEGTSGWFGVYPTSNMYGSAITTFSLTDMRCVATTAEYSIPCGSSTGLTTSTGTAASSGILSSLVPVRSLGWTAGIGSTYLQHPTLLFGADSGRTSTTSTVISADGGRSWGSSTVSLSQSAFRGGVCNDAFWNGTIWAAVGFDAVTGAKVATSRDGMSWKQIPAGNVPITGILYSIMWNGTVWMVGGDGSPTNDAFTASIAWSTDLITWNAITNTDTKLTITKRIAWNGMYWVAVGVGDVSTIMHSRDTRGLVWEDTFLSSSSTNKTASIISVVNDVVWGGGRWVAVGRGNSIAGGSGISILYSVDTPVSGGTPAEYATTGRRWTAVAGSAQLFPYGANSISWNGKRFVATGPASGTCSTGNIIAWSADGISWNAFSTTKTIAPGQRWVAVGSGSRASIALSADGHVWTDVSGSALLFSDISGASATLVNTMKTGGRAIGWNGNSLVVGGARSATTVTATSQFTATSTIGRTTIPVCAFIGSGNGVMGGGTTNSPMDNTAASYLRTSSSVFITHLDVNIREGSAPWSNMWLNTYTDLSGTQLFQVTPEAHTFSSALKWNGWSWVANFGLTTNNPITGEQYGSIWYCTDPLARVGWSVASNYATPRILIGQGGYAALEWNGVAWLACGYDPNNNNLIYTTDRYGSIGWTAVTGIVSGTGSASFQPVCIASSSRFWVVGGSQGTTSAMYYTSDRTGATGWRAIVSSVLPGIRITSIGYNESAWICCGGGGGGSGSPASSISWRVDADDIGTGWVASTISGTNGGLPPVLSGSSAVAYNAGAESPIWLVVGDVTSNSADQIAYTSTINGSTEWKKPTGGNTLSNTTFGRLNGIAWTGYSWLATSGAGGSRIASTLNPAAASAQWNNTTNAIFSPTLCTNAVAYVNIPISLLTTGMPTSGGSGAGTGAMWRGGVGRAQGLLPSGGTETTSVVVRSENGAEGTRWSPVYSRNFLIAVGGGIIRDAQGGGGANRMAYSYDGGLSWTTNNTSVMTTSSNYSVGSIRTVKYGNGMWVAGGDSTNTPAGSNTLAWSRDGINWTGAGGTQIFGTNGSCYAVCCNDRGRWVAVGGSQLSTAGTYTNTSGAIYTMAWSDDGMNWTPILGSRALFGIVCQGVTYGADAAGVGMWTAIGRGTTYTGCAYSYDGKNWYLSQTSGSLFGTSANVLTERYAPVADWRTVAINSTGQIQFAAANAGLVWRSMDYGVSWSALTLPSRAWASVAVSSTGQHVVAASSDGSNHRLYNSSDYGVTWIGRGYASNTLKQVAISATGQYQVVVANSLNIQISRDYGVTWQGPTSGGTSSYNLTGVAISSSGQYITFVCSSFNVQQSSDYGLTFTSRSSAWNWSCVAMSSTGQIQIGSSDTNNIYVSIDYGVNWNQSNAPSVGVRYRSVAISSTGQYRSGVHETTSAYIYRSTNYDSGWGSFNPAGNHFAIAMSSSGQYQTAVSQTASGNVFISSNFGETWSSAANDSRSLGITYGKDSTGTGMWVATAGRRDRDVAASTANTMAYSYDGKLWRGITAAAGLSEQAWSVAYGKDGFGVGMWVAGGYDAVCGLKWSYDGVTWNASTGASGASVWVGAAAGRRAISVYWNGSMWLASTSDTRNGEPRGTSIAANNASGVPGYLLYSYNGKNWLPVLAPNTYTATISASAQPSIYSVLPNPVILDFGSFYDDQAQRGTMIANTTALTVGAAMSSVPIENVNTIVPYGKGSMTTGQVPFLLGGDSGLVNTIPGTNTGIVPITNELASTTSSLSTSTDGGITWRAIPNSTRVMTKVNKILCDESTQQIVAVGTGNYSVATSTPATAGNADGWTGVFGSRMTDTRTGLFERFGTGASWFSGAKMWIASGRAQTRRGSSLAVSVNGTVWQDAKIVSQTTASLAGPTRGGGMVTRTTSSIATPVVGMNSIDSTPTTGGEIDSLYQFTTHTFTNASATGRDGPSLSAVRTAYSSTGWAATHVNMTTNGIQEWTVPATGSYIIKAAGAGGNGGTGSLGGRGYIITSSHYLTKGQIIKILVGQVGTTSYGKGGGGGTFVATITNTPLVVCGGGGGVNYASNSTREDAVGIGVSDVAGADGDGDENGGSGQNGSGGASFTYNSNYAKSFINGGQGGPVPRNGGGNGVSYGGFGGGGGGGNGGGGGGGYRGGKGGSNPPYISGYGGGSYCATSIISTDYNLSGAEGYVTITANFPINQTTPLYYSLPTFGGVVPYSSLAVSTSVVPYTAATTPLLTYTDSATAFSTQVSSVATNSQYNRAVVGGSSVQFVAGGRGANGGLAYSNGGQTWTAASTGTSAVFQTPTNVTTRTGSGGFDASFGTVALTQRLTTPLTYPNGTLYTCAINETGQYQTAPIYGGQIWTSSDYGVTWNARETNRNWLRIFMSSSGQYQTVVIRDGNIWTSSDYGVTWTSRADSRPWYGISISSTGQYQTAIAYGSNNIWTSSDYGVTWTPRASGREWYHVSVSSTGQYQTAVVYGGQIWGSSDFGVSWSARESSRNWVSISISSTGQYQTAAVESSHLYISSDFGITWTSRLTDTGRNWTHSGMSMSTTGQYQSAIVYSTSTNGYIYGSSDFGDTWTTRMTNTNRNWTGISLSGTGQVQLALEQNTIFTSTNYGVTWVQRSTATRTNAFTRIKSSASGQYQLATSGPVRNPYGQFYVSSNYGQTWIPRRGLSSWLGGAVSGNGAVMMGISNITTNISALKMNNAMAYSPILYLDATNSSSYNGSIWTNLGSLSGNVVMTDMGSFDAADNGGSFNFNGSSNYGRLTTSSTTFSNVTYIAVVKPSTVSNRNVILSLDYWNPTLTKYNNELEFYSSSPSFSPKASSFTIVANTWYVVASTYNTTTGSVTFYVNGVSVGNTTVATSASWSGSIFTIGADSSNGYKWHGKISSVAVYNRALSADEIYTLSIQSAIIIRSTDYGNTFNDISGTSLPSAYWRSIATTNTASNQTAVAYGGSIYRSSDTGATWSNAGITIDGSANANTITPRNWQDVAISAETGVVQVTCVSGGYLYVSSNTGATWDSSGIVIDGSVSQLANRSWQAVALSANGQYGLACANPGFLYRSTNSGASWMSSNLVIDGVGTQTAERTWNDVGMSANGKYQVACGNLNIFYSKDYGANWVLLNAAGSRFWSSVALSENGSTISATTNDSAGAIWTYTMPDDQYYLPAVLANSGSTTTAATVRAVAYGNSGTGAAVDGYWVAGADASANTLAYSTNGIDWTAVVGSKTTLFNTVNSVAYGVDTSGTPVWVAVGLPFVGSVVGLTAYSIAYSYNMTTWVGVRNTANFTGQGNHVVYGRDEFGAGMWVAVGQGDGALSANLGDSALYNSNGATNTTIFYSYDGANWAAATGAGVFSTSGTDVTWGVDASGVATWVATGVGYTDLLTGIFTPGGQVAHSVNGRVWTPIRAPTAITPALSATTLPDTTRGSTMVAPPASTGFITPTTNNIWRMLGGDIDGEALDDYSGYSVSMSADGTIVAIGATHNDGSASNAGHVRVYSYNPNKTVAQMNQNLPGFGPVGWDRLGADIDGEAADDQSLYNRNSVVLSADGSTVAIGSNLNDGNGSNSGHVRIYKYTPSKTVAVTTQTDASFGPIGWNRLGDDIDGEAANDESGWSVGLSADGNIVAIGAWGNNGAASDAGHVRVYKYTPSKTVAVTNQTDASFGPIGWNRLGADIDGEAIDDRSGTGLAISADGTTIAIGAHLNDGTSAKTDDGRGHVRVYKYSATKTTAQMNQTVPNFGPIGWNRLGEDIDNDEYLYENYGPITLPTYNVLNFPVLNSISNWEIDISFTSTNRNNDWRGLIGSMRNAVDTNRGWGIWVSSSNGIHYSHNNTQYDSFNGNVSLSIPYNLNVTKVGSSITLRLLNLSTEAILTNSFSLSDPLGLGPVSIGGWPGAPQETFGGTISYVKVLTFFQSQSGASVSLSADGSIVAIGASRNDENGIDSGHVRVYKYNPNKNITNSTGPVGWDRLGGDIDGESSYDNSGLSVSLSADGTVVAVGAQTNDNVTGTNRGNVRVYKYNPSKNTAVTNQSLPNFGPVGWERIGVDIDGEAPSEYSGYSVSLSADGTTLAIGAIYNDGAGNDAGQVRVYKLDTFSAITYTSSNPSVAEIYGNTLLFIKEGASGTTTITATQAATPPFTLTPITVQGTLTVSGTTYTLQYNSIMTTFTPFTGTGASALTVAYGRAGSQGTGVPLWIVGGSGGNVFARSSRPSAITASTWTVDASNAVSVPFPVCNSLIYSNGVWVAGNNTDATNILARSVNGGITWTPVTASSMSSILTGAAAVGANTSCNYSLAYADYSNDRNLRSWIAVQGTKNFMFEGGVSAIATVTPDISATVYGSTGTRAWWVAGGIGLDGTASLGYTTDSNGATGWTMATSAGITNLARITSVAFSPFTQQWAAVGAGAIGSLGTNILISDVLGVTWTATSVATAATPVITLNTCIWNQLPTPTTVSASGRWLVGGTRNSGGVNNVSVANSASLYISTDASGAASPWTPITGTGAILSQVYSLAYNGRVWIAAGVPATDGGSTSTLMRTTDPSGATGWVGITATNTSVGGFDTAARSITWNADDQMWIATGENSATTGSGGAVDASFSSVIYSLDVSGGTGTWRSVRESNSICFSGEGTGVAFTGDRWFASGEGNKQIVATTGTNAATAATASWSTVSHATTLTRASDIAYTGRRLIATGSGTGSTNGIILSTDNTGASWTAGPSTGFNDAAGGGTSINFEASYEGVGRIVATGRTATTNTLSVSTDGGSTWSAPSVQFNSTNTFDTVTQPLFTTGGNSVAYVGNDTLFASGGNDVHWTGKRWVATGRNSAVTIDTVPVSVTSASVPATAPVDIINNNTTPVATSEDGITWQCVSVSQAPNLSEGTFMATNSRIGSTPLIDSKITITDGGDTEPNMDYGGMTCGIGGSGTGVAAIDIIAELTPSSLAASSTGAVGVIGAAGNGGANNVGHATIASFDTTAFTITTRPTPI